MIRSSSNHLPPIANPYIVGNPIEDRKMFFGREDDFAYIKQKVTGSDTGGMLVLCGTRRSGKTSILFQLKGGRLGEGFVPVLVDMQSMTVEDDREFLDKLAKAIITALDDPGFSYDRDYRAGADSNPYSAFQDLITAIHASLKGRKMLLMFDEYEIFESHIESGRLSKDILHLLANWMEGRGGVFIVFTGSDKLEARSAKCWESFLGKALHRRISFLSRNDTLRLIREPLEGVVSYEEGIPEEIYHLTAGQPFYSQVLCQSIVDHLNEIHSYEVTAEDAQQAVGEIIENPLPHMVFTWSSLTDLDKVSLSIAAEMSREDVQPLQPGQILQFPQEEGLGVRLDENKLNESLERLFHHDLLQKTQEGGSYTYKMDLWRQWVSRMHSIYQVLDEIGGPKGEYGEGIEALRPRRWHIPIITTFVVVALVMGGLYFGGFFKAEPIPISIPVAQTVAIADSSTLTITTDPPEAMVFLGDKRLGRSPITDRRVPVGKQPLTVELAGYKVFTDTLVLEKDQPLDREVAMTRRVGGFHVTSQPSGARIILNDEDSGQITPATFNGLPASDPVDVRLRLTGYRDGVFRSLPVHEDSVSSVTHNFAQMTYPLTILAQPSDASIYLDGQLLGASPRNLDALTQGGHQLEVRKPGFQSVSQQISLPVPSNMVEVALTPLPPGTLVIQVQPYADVWIDGQLKAESTTFYEIELDVAAHEIELRHPSYENHSRTVEIQTGETHRIQHDFARD